MPVMARRRRRAHESCGSVAPVGHGAQPHFVLGSWLPIRALGGRRRKHGALPLLADALIGPIGPPRPGWKAARHRRAGRTAADMADAHAQRLVLHAGHAGRFGDVVVEPLRRKFIRKLQLAPLFDTFSSLSGVPESTKRVVRPRSTAQRRSTHPRGPAQAWSQPGSATMR